PSNSRAASRLRGRGRPWEMIVDSSATTGRPRLRASATSADGMNGAGVLMAPQAYGSRPRPLRAGTPAVLPTVADWLPCRGCTPGVPTTTLLDAPNDERRPT